MDWTEYLRFVAALGFVLALLGLLGVLLKRFGSGGKFMPTTKGGRRLDIVEILPLDAKRRIYIIRRDAVEHVILLGENGETVVEKGIVPPVEEEEEGEQA